MALLGAVGPMHNKPPQAQEPTPVHRPIEKSHTQSAVGITTPTLSEDNAPFHAVPLPKFSPERTSPQGGTSKESNSIPKDVLTSQELAKAHIRIINGPQTELLLRKGALDQFKLFRDAKNGKINEVVIVLVDDNGINFNLNGTSDEEARDIYEAVHYAPGEWDQLIYMENVQNLQWNISHFQNLLDGKEKPNPMDPPFNKEALTAAIEMYKHQLEELNGKAPKLTPQQFEQELQSTTYWGEIMQTGSIAQDAETLIPEHPKAKRDREALLKYGNLDNKVYVFLAVGGNLAPTPDQSYPNPDRFYSNMGDSRGYVFDNKTPGFVLAHELGHYEGKNPYDAKRSRFFDETKADAQGFARMVQAWNKQEEEGSDSDFTFVLRNKSGVTITANENAPRGTNQNL